MATLFVGNKIWGQEKTYIEVITDKLNNVLDYIKNNNPSYKNIFNPYKTDYDITKIIEIHSKLLEAKIPQDEVIESLSKADKKQWKLYKSKENKIKLEYSDLMDELVQYTNMKEYYFDMIFYNIVKDIDYEKIKDDIIRFICFNHSLTLFCGKYITSSYGFQSIVDFTDEFKEMNEVYNDIINCLKI